MHVLVTLWCSSHTICQTRTSGPTLPSTAHALCCKFPHFYPAVCPPGTFGPGCLECLAGSFCPGGIGPVSRGAGPAPIIKCPEHMTSNKSATSESSCYCMAGYGGQSCNKCASGSFSEGGSRNECQMCARGQTSMEAAPSKDYCFCATGESGACTACPAGTWSEQGACRRCVDKKTSDIGAISPADCCKSAVMLL